MNKLKKARSFATQQSKSAQAQAPQQVQDIPRAVPATAVIPTHEEIARRAYEIYVEKGCPQGQSEQIWLQAEQDIRDLSLAAYSSRRLRTDSSILNSTKSAKSSRGNKPAAPALR